MTLSRELARASRRFADQNTDRIAELPQGKPFMATVTDVVEGVSPGGWALITVSWRGETYRANGYADNYTPVVGHRVRCELVDNQLLVNYRILS